MQNYPNIVGSDAVKDSRQMLLDRDDTLKTHFSGTEAPSVTADDIGCIWFDTNDRNFYGLVAYEDDTPTWQKVANISRINSMDLGIVSAETLFVDLTGDECKSKENMFAVVGGELLDMDDYEITNDGKRITFKTPVAQGTSIELRWFSEVIIGRDGATFVPKVENRVLSWDNDQGLPNPDSLNFNDIIDEAETTITNDLTPLVNTARVWATGEDDEVQQIEADEHSSRGYADLANAITNTPEDVPIDLSKLVALDVIKGPKGDKGDGAGTWGEIDGDIANQTDLQNALSTINNNAVHKSGNETISGNKTFTSDLKVVKNSPRVYLQASVLTRGAYSSTQDENKLNTWDKDGKPLSEYRTYVEQSDSSTTVAIGAVTEDDEGQQLYKTVFRGTAHKDGTSEVSLRDVDAVYIKTPITSSNNTQVANTAFVQNLVAQKIADALKNIDYVVEKKDPTSSDPTWYRVYKSGWVEQGGVYTVTSGTFNQSSTFNLVKTMADTNYTILGATRSGTTASATFYGINLTTTTFQCEAFRGTTGNAGYTQISWTAFGTGA